MDLKALQSCWATSGCRPPWLDHRAQTWPATTNPHLFVNRRTAPRLTPVSRPFPWKEVNFAAQALREDRILDQVHATGGDVRRIGELFDLSVEAALRYTSTLDHTDPTSKATPDSPTHGDQGTRVIRLRDPSGHQRTGDRR